MVGSRNSYRYLPWPRKLNIEFSDPAIASNEPGILGSPQLSSMNLSIELVSVSV